MSGHLALRLLESDLTVLCLESGETSGLVTMLLLESDVTVLCLESGEMSGLTSGHLALRLRLLPRNKSGHLSGQTSGRTGVLLALPLLLLGHALLVDGDLSHGPQRPNLSGKFSWRCTLLGSKEVVTLPLEVGKMLLEDPLVVPVARVFEGLQQRVEDVLPKTSMRLRCRKLEFILVGKEHMNAFDNGSGHVQGRRIFRKQGESAEESIREIQCFLVGKASLA